MSRNPGQNGAYLEGNKKKKAGAQVNYKYLGHINDELPKSGVQRSLFLEPITERLAQSFQRQGSELQ